MNHDLGSIAAALVAKGRGILAADETVPTLTKRFNALGIQTAWAKAVEDRLFIWARTPGPGAEGVAWARREPKDGSAGPLPPARCTGAASVGA